MAEHPIRLSGVQRDGRAVPPFVLPGLVLLALVVRVLVAFRTSVIFEDGPHFLDSAKRFATGDFAGALAHPYHPMYSALIAAVQPLVGDFEVAALAVSVLGGTLAVAASFLFVRDAFDARSAALAAFLFAISPYAVRFTSDVQSEGVYLAFFVGGVALSWRGLATGRAGLLFAAGLAGGFAYLTRPEGAALVVVVGVLLLARGGAVRDRLRGIAALVTGALLVAAPYISILSLASDSVTLSGKKSLIRTLGLSNQGTASITAEFGQLVVLGVLSCFVIAVAAYLWPRSRGGVLRARVWGGVACAIGGVVAWQIFWPTQLEEFARVVISTVRPEVIVLVGLGIWASIACETRRRDGFIVALLLVYGVVLVGLLFNYGYLSRRHVLPLLPLLLGYAGLGACWLSDRISRWPAERVLAAIALGMLLISAPKTLHRHRDDALAHRRVAEWMRGQDLPAGRVASNKRRIGYYAERLWFPLTEDDVLRPFERLAREGVRYIVVDDPMPGFHDQLAVESRFEVRVLHRIEAGGGMATVYELDRAGPVAGTDVSGEVSRSGAR